MESQLTETRINRSFISNLVASRDWKLTRQNSVAQTVDTFASSFFLRSPWPVGRSRHQNHLDHRWPRTRSHATIQTSFEPSFLFCSDRCLPRHHLRRTCIFLRSGHWCLESTNQGECPLFLLDSLRQRCFSKNSAPRLDIFLHRNQCDTMPKRQQRP